MRENIWEAFAQEDAEYYIDTTYQEDQHAFFKSGRSFAKQTLEDALPYLSQTKRALEIGCGVGRLTFPHAELFDEVVAADIAPTMLRKLQENASKFDYSNIRSCFANEQMNIGRTKPLIMFTLSWYFSTYRTFMKLKDISKELQAV